MLKALLVRIGGLPDNEPEAYYKDMSLSMVAAFAFLVVSVLVANNRYTSVLGMALAVLALSILLATKRWIVIGVAAAIGCMRFAIAFILAPSLTAIAAAVVLALVVVVLYVKVGNDWYDPKEPG